MDDLDSQTRDAKENTQNDGVKNLLANFALMTTAHGIGRIAASSDFRFKIAWFVVWLAVVSSFTWMVVQLAILYSSRPVSTSISISYEESLTFPGVTICNFNMILKSRAKALMQGHNSIFTKNRQPNNAKKDLFANTHRAKSGMNVSTITVDSVNSKMIDILADINDTPLEDRVKNSYQFSEFIKYCSWSGLTCDSGYFQTTYWKQNWNWKYGNCYTFNGYTSNNGTAIDPLTSSASDGGKGFYITVDIQEKEYLPGLTMEEGIRVLIADQDMPLYPFEKGFSIAPGMSATISIRKSMVEREDVFGNGSCNSAGKENTKYSVQDCATACKGNTQKRLCNCTDVQYSQIVQSRACLTDDEKTCIMFVNANFSNSVYECGSKCPPPCTVVSFTQTISQGKVFPDGYLKIHAIKNMSRSYVEKNIIQLKVLFKDQTVQRVTTGAYYKFDNLISDIGGQLGLWIGVSAVTCVEFFALIWNIVTYIGHRRTANRVKQIRY